MGGVCRLCSIDVEDPLDDCGFVVLAVTEKRWQWKNVMGLAPSVNMSLWVVYVPSPFTGFCNWVELGKIYPVWNLAKRLEFLQSGKIEQHLGVVSVVTTWSEF